MRNKISYFEINITYQTIILFPIRCTITLKTILTASYHISIKMFPKSLISKLSRVIASVYYTR